MKLEQLYYFREAVKYQSLSVAAEKNFIKQPSLSAMIAKLEKELDVCLLVRSRRGVTPTKEGVLILDQINDIFRALDNIEDIAKHSHSATSIVLSATTAFCDVLTPLLLRAIGAQNLAYDLSFITTESYMVYQHVSTGMARLGLTAFDAQLMSASLRFTPLFEDEYVLYIGPNSPFWESETITREEVLAQPYVAFGEEFQDHRADQWGRALFDGCQPAVTLRSNDYSAIRNIILHENYVSFFPKFAARHDLYITQGLLKAVPLADFSLPVQYGCLESTHYKLSEKGRQFIALIKACVSEL